MLGLAAGMFVWIWYLNREAQKHEPVFMENAKVWTTPIGVTAEDFESPTKTAVDIWNKRVGCKLFEMGGDDVTVKSGDGMPCGRMDAPGLEPQDSAGAWLCGTRAEVHVMHPGDIHTQAHIVAHELGHVLGLTHDPRGLMAHPQVISSEGVTMIRPSDKDAAALRERYCQ
jgi:hypothetical protein